MFKVFMLIGSFLLLASPYMPKAGTATAKSGGRSGRPQMRDGQIAGIIQVNPIYGF